MSLAPDSKILMYKNTAQRVYRRFLDKSTIYKKTRWGCFAGGICLYMYRVYLLAGWYIITYGLGIYLLNSFIGFLTPLKDPQINELDDEDDDEEGPILPTSAGDGEFRPFIRRLSEFKFWHSSMKAVVIAFFCTFFEVFNVPVFWPILLIYFIALFVLTMKKRIKHMIKYRYIPFDFRKKSYKGDKGKL